MKMTQYVKLIMIEKTGVEKLVSPNFRSNDSMGFM